MSSLARKIRGEESFWVDQLLQQTRLLSKGTSACPGALAQTILPKHAQPLNVLRPLLFMLAEHGKIRLTQKGQVLGWRHIRGPFRVSQRG
ncbi:MAG: DUF3253 domain-containing protein [Verrucomicrobiales bacterium]